MKISLSNLLISLTYLAIGIRWLLDRADLGVFGALLIIILFLVQVVFVRKKVQLKFALVFLGLSLFLIASSFLVIKYNGFTTYPIQPIVRYLSYLMVFYIFYTLPFSSKTFLRVYGGLILIQFVVAVFEFVVLNDDRPNGTLQNNNHIMYVLAIFFAINLFYYQRKFVSIFLAGFAAFLRGLGGIVTIASMVVSFLFLGKSRIISKLGYLLLAAIMVPILLAVYAERIEENQDIFELEQRIENEQPGGGGSLVWRIVTWTKHINYVESKNASLMGLGIDTSSSVSPYSTPVSRHDPHGDYTLLFIDFGIIGLAGYVLILVSSIIYCYIQYKKSNNHKYFALCLIGIGLFFGHTVGNLLTQSTLWWMIMGIIGIFLRENTPPSKGMRDELKQLTIET
jgi:hypothetical protein